LEPDDHPDLKELTDTIQGQRRGKFLKIYKALLNSPPLTEAWFNFNNAVRWQTELSGRLREIIIIRIAYLTGSAYALHQHVAELAEAEGLSKAQCDALDDWESSEHFSDSELAVLIGMYNMHSRVFQALDVELEDAP